MIVEMKKVTVLCLAADRDMTLDALADAGVLHLAPVLPPAGADVDRTRAELTRIRVALDVLRAAKKSGQPPAPANVEAVVDPSALVERIHELNEWQEALTEQVESLNLEKADTEPLGDFDPALLRSLAAQSVPVRLYRLNRSENPSVPAGAVLQTIREETSGRYVVLVGNGELEATEIEPPARRLQAVLDNLRFAANEQAKIDQELGSLVPGEAALEELEREAKVRHSFAEARAGMGEQAQVSWIRGFCPTKRVSLLQRLAAGAGWGLLIEDPTEDDPVPTLLSNAAWARPILVLMDLIGIVPGYREIDISAVFLLFYSVFFAMLVGDAGYGLLFLGLTILLKLFAKKAPPEMTRLLGVLSVCTIIWGVLTGSFFGIRPESLPRFMTLGRIDWLGNETNLMNLCFLIGSIHLTVAHAWNAFRNLKNLTFLAQLGWIAMTWTMYFMAGFMILDKPLPGFVPWLFVAGLASIVLFMTPLRAMKTEWYNHIMLPLSIIGNFGDIVSYVRLFAVGSAGAAISLAFNDIAIGDGIHSIGAGLAAALILFVAHAVNIMLCALGVIVHGVRLNTLEFSGHLGMQWTGLKYRPFSRTAGAA